MKRHIFDIDVLPEKRHDGMAESAALHACAHRRRGLTRKQVIELWRLDFEERERRLDEMRRRTAV
jgi:hypothetical protein